MLFARVPKLRGALLLALMLVSPAQAQQISRPAPLPQVIPLHDEALASRDAVRVSAAFVDRVIHDLPVAAYLAYFKQLDADGLERSLDTQARRLAFWINVYNGYTQYFLKTDPSAYLQSRPRYFGKDQIDIAGDRVSLSDIEHGVLRRGATTFSLGHLRLLWLRRPFVRRFALDAVDYRIHFALNCGALSCPPVLPYTAEQVDQQLDAGTRDYLQRTVRQDAQNQVVEVPALLRWFSADFMGGSNEAKREILRRYGVIAGDASPRIRYLPYDWTLQINNYALFTPAPESRP